MARGLLSGIGGALQGVGAGMVEKGKQAREDRIRERMMVREDRHRSEDRSYAVADREDTQAFQSSERMAGQDFTADQNAANREFTRGERVAGEEFTAGQNEAGRAHDKGLLDKRLEHDKTMADREHERRAGLVADIVTGKDGNLVGITPAGDAIQITDSSGQAVTKDNSAAFREAYQRFYGDIGKADIYGRKSDAQIAAEAARQAADLVNGETMRKAMGSADLPEAPRDINDRVVGQVYQAPNGKQVKWTENGWLEVTD